MLKQYKKTKNTKGFTMIELIVVIAIIAILVLLASPFYKGYARKATIAGAQHDAKVLEQALESKSVGNDKLYDPILSTPADIETLKELAASGHLIDIKGPVDKDLSGEIFYEMSGGYEKKELDVRKTDRTKAYTTKEGYVVISIVNAGSQTDMSGTTAKKEFSDNDYFTVNEFGVLTQYHPTGKVWGSPLPRIYDLVVPEVYVFEDGSTVTITEIGDRVFQEIAWDRRDIASIILPDTLKIIGQYAFYESTMESIVLPDGITEIKEGAFAAGRLKTLTLGSGLQTLGIKAFKNNVIETIVIPGNVWEIGAEAFENNILHTVDIKNGVNTVGNRAFYGNPIHTLTLGDSIEHIGIDAFRRAENYLGGLGLLTQLDLPDNIKTIGSYAFFSHSIGSLTLPASLELIDTGAFMDNRIEYLNFSEYGNLHTINSYAFYNNKITELTIPSSVVSIGDYAFFGNYLDFLEMKNGITNLDNFGVFSLASRYSPTSFLSTVILPSSVVSVSDYYFAEVINGWSEIGYAGAWFAELDMNSGRLNMIKKP